MSLPGLEQLCLDSAVSKQPVISAELISNKLPLLTKCRSHPG